MQGVLTFEVLNNKSKRCIKQEKKRESEKREEMQDSTRISKKTKEEEEEEEAETMVVAHARQPFALPAALATRIYDALHAFILQALPSDHCIIRLVAGHDWHAAAVFYLGSTPATDSVCLRLTLLASAAHHHHLTCSSRGQLHGASAAHSSAKLDYDAGFSTSSLMHFPKILQTYKTCLEADEKGYEDAYNEDNLTKTTLIGCSSTCMTSEQARSQFREGLEMLRGTLEEGYKWGLIVSGCICIEYYAGSYAKNLEHASKNSHPFCFSKGLDFPRGNLEFPTFMPSLTAT
ncbi:hypothetical protein L7F22_059354 [Adiantum nelumboides]|nr:hypothetical protein [Adiantum nelumboides]